jgi:hypothetical protein
MAAVEPLRTASGLMMLNVRCDIVCLSTPEGFWSIRFALLRVPENAASG